MVGILVFNIIINAILFSFIFWILTFVSKYLYSNKYYNTKNNFYECGFKNINKKPAYEINFILLLLFILIYDGEFLLIIPFSLNANVYTPEVFLCFFFFFLLFIISLLFDYSYSALEWQI